MLRSWRVPLIVTRHSYMYQSFILSKKLISKNKLTGRPSPTVQYHNLPQQKSPAVESPTAKQSSTTISHSKKVQQQNLPPQNSPVPQSPTSKQSSSRKAKGGALYLVFPVTVIVISVFLPCLSIRSIIDFLFGHGSQSKIQYQNLFSASCLRGLPDVPRFLQISYPYLNQALKHNQLATNYSCHG